jgi:hypothetical protein
MILLLIVFTRGLILSKIIMSIGLCLRIGLRIEKTIRAMIAEKVASVNSTSPIMSVVISQVPIIRGNCKTQSKTENLKKRIISDV